MRISTERALSALALLVAVLAAVWAFPLSGKGGLLVFGAAVSAIPAAFPNRKVFGTCCAVLVSLAVLGLLWSGVLLLPVAVIFALLSMRGRIAEVLAGGVAVISIVGLSNGLYREYFQTFDVFTATMAAQPSPETVQALLADPAVTSISWSGGTMEVSFQHGSAESELVLLRERIEHLPGTLSVRRCEGTLMC